MTRTLTDTDIDDRIRRAAGLVVMFIRHADNHPEDTDARGRALAAVATWQAISGVDDTEAAITHAHHVAGIEP